MHQTGDEDQAMQKALSMSLESHRQEEDKKKQNNTSFDEKGQSTNSRQSCPLVSLLARPSKMHQTGDEDQAMRKALSMSLESHRQEEDRKKQNSTSFDKKGQSTSSRQPFPLVSPLARPSKMHQTGDEDQAMRKALSMSLESHRQEEDRKKQNNTSFDKKGQSTRSRQPCPLFSPLARPSKMHQTGDEDQAMQKALSMSLESHRQEKDKKKQKNTSFNEKGQSTNSRQPCPPVSPQAKKSGTTHSQRKESNDLSSKEREKNTISLPKTQKTGRQTNTTISSSKSGTTHSQRKESNDLSSKKREKNPKSPQKTQKTGVQTNTTNSPSKVPLLSPEKAIPLCLPNNFSWDPMSGNIHKTDDKRCSLALIPAAIEMLEGIKEPVCVVSIVGPYRQGKSYILSEVFGGKNIFPIGHYLDPETFGLWMWIVPEVFQDSSGRDFRVILLDSEGIDAVTAGGQNDNQIFTLTVLLASVLIYNSKGVPKRTDLNGLDFIVKMSKKIRIRSESGSDDKELFRNTFPFFIWLLRDTTNQIPPDCKDINQYFAKRVFKESAETTNSEKDGQKVGESILQLFAGFEAFALPTPSIEDEVLQDMSNSREKLSQKFLQALQKFEALLKSKLTPKPSINKGEKITGQALGVLVKLYTDALNDPNAIPNVEAAWDTYVKEKCSEVKTRALQIYDQNMTRQMKSIFPCEDEEILKHHERFQERSMQLYADETAEFISICTGKESRELSENMEQQMKAWLEENATCTRQECEKLLRDLKAEYVDPVFKCVRNSRHDGEVKYSDIMDQCNTLEHEFAKKAIGAKDVRADVFLNFTKELHDEVSKYREILLKLKDFNDHLAKEKMAVAYQEKVKMKLQKEINQMKKKEEAWEKKVTRLEEKQKADLESVKEQAKADKESLEKNMEIVHDAHMKSREQFQAMLKATTDREKQAAQALMNLQERYDYEGSKAQKQIECLRTEMQNATDENAQAQEQMQQQLEAHESKIEKSDTTITKLKLQLAKAREELLSIEKQKEKLKAKLDEATKPGFLTWLWRSIF